jgi:hypothetical protein
MGRASTTEKIITSLAKKYPQMRFVDSNIKGLYYAVAPKDDRLAILCGGGVALFTLEQLYAMRNEAIDVWTNIIDEKCKNNGVPYVSLR